MCEVPDEKVEVIGHWQVPVRKKRSGESATWPASYASRRAPSSHQARRAIPESWYPHRCSIAIPFARDKFRSTHLQGLAPVKFLQPPQEIRSPSANRRLG